MERSTGIWGKESAKKKGGCLYFAANLSIAAAYPRRPREVSAEESVKPAEIIEETATDVKNTLEGK